MEETWRGVVGYESYFEVSNTGKIRSLNYKKSGKPGELKQYQDRDGYKQLVVYSGGKSKLFKVHRKVAEAFLPNPDKLPVIMHLDDDPSNNHVSNLRWGTQAENLSTVDPKKRKPKTVLTEDQRKQIPILYATGNYTQLDLCEMFDVRIATINRYLRT